MFICHYIRIQICCKLCITNSYVTTSEFTIHHISWKNLHHKFKTIMALLRNSFNFLTIIASERFRHFLATKAPIFAMTRHILFGGSGHTVSHFVEKKADKLTPGVSEFTCKKELGQNTYRKLCKSRNQQVFF